MAKKYYTGFMKDRNGKCIRGENGKPMTYGEKVQKDNEKFRRENPSLDWHGKHRDAWSD